MGKIYNGGKNYGQGTDEGTFTIGDESGYYIDITTYPYAQVRIGEANDTENPPETIINPQDISTELVETNDVHKGIEVGSTAYWGYYEPEQGQELNPKSSSLDESLTWLRQNLGGDRNSTLDGKITYDEQDDQVEISEAVSVDGSVTVNHDLIKGGSRGYWGYEASPQAHTTSLDSFASWVLGSFDSLDGITHNTSSGYYSIDGMKIYDDDIVTSNVDGWGYHATASEYSTSLGETIQWLRENCGGDDDGTVEIGNGDIVLNSNIQGSSYWTETDESHSLYTTLHDMDDRICGYIRNYGYHTQDVTVSGDVHTEDRNGWGYYEGEEDDTSLKYVISDILSRLSTLENK